MNALRMAGGFAAVVVGATAAAVAAFVGALHAEARAQQRNRNVSQRVEW